MAYNKRDILDMGIDGMFGILLLVCGANCRELFE
jgi:hypothetical protein